MKKIDFQLILIISSFISYILSEYNVNQDGETCDDAPYEPEFDYECTSYNTEDKACCFAKVELHDRSTINRCIAVEKDARFALNYLTIFTFTDKQGTEYKDVIADFQCGQTDGYCGMDAPNKLFQCSEHSSTTKSCCYLTTPTYTECILSPNKYNKETKFVLFDESSVVCNSNKIKINKSILFFSFLLLMNLIYQN